ncbi:hypothetical protein E6B08_13935 [Pseudomonas putida]|uniref:Uncharacterized protein n=1 Tax=Pseudomonas putida TaxID=303 RepID=A0A4D6XNE2_PSEPU|nr:hypothetical protein E6B08_13935 [Pseudomonas putida]
MDAKASSHRYNCDFGNGEDPVGAGLPAKQTPRCMAPASPVFAGKPAPTGAAQALAVVKIL